MIVAYQDGKVDHERMLAEVREQAAARAAAKVGPEAHRIGAIALVEPGMEVYSRDRRDEDDWPIGGVVVEVVHGMDPETGESLRSFVCLSSRPEHGRSFRIRRISEMELGEADIQLANSSTLKGMAARVHESAAKALRKRGPVLPEVDTWGEWARMLDHLIVFGARR